jgi:hypothetical protein
MSHTLYKTTSKSNIEHINYLDSLRTNNVDQKYEKYILTTFGNMFGYYKLEVINDIQSINTKVASDVIKILYDNNKLDNSSILSIMENVSGYLILNNTYNFKNKELFDFLIEKYSHMFSNKQIEHLILQSEK